MRLKGHNIKKSRKHKLKNLGFFVLKLALHYYILGNLEKVIVIKVNSLFLMLFISDTLRSWPAIC